MGAELIFGTAKVTTSIAAYFGLIENVSSDVKKLLHEPFLSAIDNLKQAMGASSERSRYNCIEKARENFTKAKALEKDENLVSSLFGLAMCQYYLGDVHNAQTSLQEIESLQLSSAKKRVALTAVTFVVAPIFAAVPGYAWYQREKRFEDYKQKVTTLKIK